MFCHISPQISFLSKASSTLGKSLCLLTSCSPSVFACVQCKGSPVIDISNVHADALDDKAAASQPLQQKLCGFVGPIFPLVEDKMQQQVWMTG